MLTYWGRVQNNRCMWVLTDWGRVQKVSCPQQIIQIHTSDRIWCSKMQSHFTFFKYVITKAEYTGQYYWQ